MLTIQGLRSGLACKQLGIWVPSLRDMLGLLDLRVVLRVRGMQCVPKDSGFVAESELR